MTRRLVRRAGTVLAALTIGAAGLPAYASASAAVSTVAGPVAVARPLHVDLVTTLGASVDGTQWSWARTLGGPPPITQPPITASAVGGTAPYSYSWVRVSGDTGTTAASPSSASTTWQRTIPPNSHANDWFSGWQCLVADSAGGFAWTPLVSVDFDWETGE